MTMMTEDRNVNVPCTWRRIQSAGHDGIFGPLVLSSTSGVASSSERVHMEHSPSTTTTNAAKLL